MHFHKMHAFSRKFNKTPDFQSDVPFSLKNLKGTVWRLSHNIRKIG